MSSNRYNTIDNSDNSNSDDYYPLRLTPSAECLDYLQTKKQFQLHSLLTEQRHPNTIGLSDVITSDSTENGLKMLNSVDLDIERKLTLNDTDESVQLLNGLNLLISAIERAIVNKRKIYVYGCGATGRLAKQIESTFWRPFWNSLINSQNEQIRQIYQEKIKNYRLNDSDNSNSSNSLSASIVDDLIGEMTGGDRALISSLEGFEDLLLIGELQLKSHNITSDDVVIAVTEGGETSSVIGTVLYAEEQFNNREESWKNLFFVYNNPSTVLMPFDRSHRVLENTGITKINLTSGPQAITGSTRMQATSISTFTIASCLHVSLQQFLSRILTTTEMSTLGFTKQVTITEKLATFTHIHRSIYNNLSSISRFTDLESSVYSVGSRCSYYGVNGLMTLFIDGTERSPTFRLNALDTLEMLKRQCWISIYTSGQTLDQSWYQLLGREFNGLEKSEYLQPFNERIDDKYLKMVALRSLENAGKHEKLKYNFSVNQGNLGRIAKSANIINNTSNNNSSDRSKHISELGVCVLLNEEIEKLISFNGKQADANGFEAETLAFVRSIIDIDQSHLVVIAVSDNSDNTTVERLQQSLNIPTSYHSSFTVVPVVISRENDPLQISAQIALKLLLNMHSTATMTKIGKVVSNTMTNVSASNLKLIGRATALMLMHINERLYNVKQAVNASSIDNSHQLLPVQYSLANAILFDTKTELKQLMENNPDLTRGAQIAEVPTSIVRILETIYREESTNSSNANNNSTSAHSDQDTQFISCEQAIQALSQEQNNLNFYLNTFEKRMKQILQRA